ncbi:conserved hypothetical protein [Cenarchaeum symbiosum A]|uniref:Nucleotidyl transferase AbiEii/AbiGii toxin family protein n=1 Tax=Cenarchaeum symbiosum (strain A) TaxID=414004 RepID=A0RWG1_CENSY|nr:conserved hypothetical protein [Cenarchaeum symbiosum A]
MDARTIQSLAAKNRIPRGTLEKDYTLSSLLSIIADFPGIDKIVFKGGTSVKKMFFRDFRYSEDLDFNGLEDVTEDLIEHLRGNMGGLNVDFTEIIPKDRTRVSASFRVMYKSVNGTRSSVNVDMSMRMNLMMKPQTREMLTDYEDLPGPYHIPVMDLEEIMAEKISAVTYSAHARHVYDVWFLHEHGVKIRPEMAKEKIITVHGEKFELEKFMDGVDKKRGNWVDGLRQYMPHGMPSFEDISEKVRGIVTDAMG